MINVNITKKSLKAVMALICLLGDSNVYVKAD